MQVRVLSELLLTINKEENMNNPSSSLRIFGQTYLWLTLIATIILLFNGSFKQPAYSEYTGTLKGFEFTALSFGYLFALVMHAIIVKLVFSYMAFMAESHDKKTLTLNETSI